MTTYTTTSVPIEASLLPPLSSIWALRKSSQSSSQSDTIQENINSYPSRYAIQPSQYSISARNPSRSASSASRDAYGGSNSRWKHFWRFQRDRQRPVAPLESNDLSPLAGFLDDNTSFGRMLRPANELKLRCTEFDESGNVTLVNGEFKKTELIAKYGLLPRDLRKIDSSLLPSFIVRPSAIMINLLHLRVLIKHNRVLVLDSYGSTNSYAQSLFMYDLEGKLRLPEARTAASTMGAPLPYEFRALEAVLISVTNALEGEFEMVREPVVRLLRDLEEDIDRDKLRHLLIYSKKLGTFEQKARLVRDAIDDLLEADDDLAAMYLSEKSSGKGRAEDEHTEVEMLLESYHRVCDEIVQVSGNLVSNIRNTEEIVKAILDANRNSLMLLDLKFSIGTLGIAGGTFVAALYGMNLKNFIEESDLGFWGVSAWCTVASVIVCLYGLRKLRRVQRVSMWGHGGGGHGGGADPIKGRTGWGRLPERTPVSAPAPATPHTESITAGLGGSGGGGARRERESLRSLRMPHHDTAAAAESRPLATVPLKSRQ